MLKGLYTAYTGMINEQNRMDVLTNNLANADTTGFKKEGATSQSFDSVFVDKLKDDSEYIRQGRRIGTGNPGVKIGESYTDFSQGALQVTDATYDFAIGGKGFFAVEFTNKNDETTTMYTRDGNFDINTDGYLVTTDGDYVLSSSGDKIKLDPNLPLIVDREGNIFQNDVRIDQIGVVDFEDYNYLKHYGENYFTPVEGATEIEDPERIVYQGYLETSNVSIVSEMVEMISVSRQYEANQKLIQTYDSSLDIAVNRLGQI